MFFGFSITTFVKSGDKNDFRLLESLESFVT